MTTTPVMLGMLLIVAEVLLVGIVFLVFFLMKSRKKIHPSESGHNSTTNKSGAQSHVGSPPKDFSYWLAEIDKTKKALLARDASAVNNTENIDYLPLNIRLQCLELEHKLVQMEPDKRSIQSVEADITGILKRFQIIHAINVMREKRERSDGQDTKNIIEQQKKTIDYLRKYTEEILGKILKQNEEFMKTLKNKDDLEKMNHVQQEFIRMSETMPEKINQLETINMELSQCVAVLEDENQFLRDQIAALLTVSEAKSV
jgi:hypothetical protein